MKKMTFGLFVCTLVAVIAHFVSLLPVFPFSIQHGSKLIHPIEPMIIAIIIGVVISSLLPVVSRKNTSLENINGIVSSSALLEQLTPGVNFAIKSLLPLGIVFMGANFNFLTVVKVSLHALIINLLCIACAYFLTQWVCAKLSMDKKMSALITIGTAICGSSAIVAVSPVIKSSSNQTATAMTIISLYGLLAIFVFPLLGHLLHLTDMSYGIWSGTVIQAVPQVVAAGFAYSFAAGQIAIIVKMVRVLLLGPMTVIIGMQYHRKQGTTIGPWYQYFPIFILFFLLMVLVNTFGLIDYLGENFHFPLQSILLMLSSFLMTVAMAGVGMNTNLAQLFKSGGKPLVAGGVAMLVLAITSLLLISFI